MACPQDMTSLVGQTGILFTDQTGILFTDQTGILFTDQTGILFTDQTGILFTPTLKEVRRSSFFLYSLKGKKRPNKAQKHLSNGLYKKLGINRKAKCRRVLGKKDV